MAAAQYFWGAPYFERLPAAYTAETTYAAKCRSRQSPTAPLEEYETITRRHDQTLNSVAGSAIIQGDIHWVTPAGVVMFEVLSLYGVDRRTRENLPGYGNEERTGLYLFPPDTEKKEYRQWDPIYAGPRTATFERTEQLDGMEVYVFNFVADGIDETSGYVALPDVPERYRATTYGKGKVSVILEEIRAAIARQDGIGWARSAHALLSSLGPFGAKEASRFTRELEELGGEGDPPDSARAGTKFLQLEEAVAHLSRSLEKFSRAPAYGSVAIGISPEPPNETGLTKPPMGRRKCAREDSNFKPSDP